MASRALMPCSHFVVEESLIDSVAMTTQVVQAHFLLLKAVSRLESLGGRFHTATVL